MIGARWIASTTAIVTIFALLAPGVAAQADPAAYAELEFTVIIEDAQDHVGILDIREVALGEPGDGTLVARFTVQDFSTQAGTESFHFFMTTPAGSFRAGFDASGGPSTHSSSNGGFDSCAVDGSVVYCVLPYDAIEAEVGSELTGTSVITYQTVAQDFAPGGYFESSVLGNTGDDYTITGGDAAAAPAVETLAIDAEAEQTIEGHGTATFPVTITNQGADNATFNMTVGNTTDDLPLTFDPASATLAANESITVQAAVDVPEGTQPGEYSWDVRAEGLNGGNVSLTLTLIVSAPMDHSGHEMGDADGNETAGNATGQESDESALGIPGFEALAVAGALLAALVVTRRRRHA